MMIFLLVIFFLSIIGTFVLIAVDEAELTFFTIIVALISLLIFLEMIIQAKFPLRARAKLGVDKLVFFLYNISVS